MSTEPTLSPPPLDPPAHIEPAPVAPPRRPRERTTARVMRPYVLAWALLAIIAAAYVAVAGLRPDLASSVLGDRQPGEPENNQGQRAMSKALAEVQSLRQGLTQVQLDVSKLKTEAQSRDEQDRQLSQRISALEQAGASKVAAAATAPAVAAASKDLPAFAGASAPAGAPSATKAPAKASAATTAALEPEQLRVLNAASPKIDGKLDDKSAIETGSIAPAGQAAQTAAAAAAPVAFGAPVVTPAPKPVAVQIASGASIDALRLSWSLLSEKHGVELRKLEPRYVAGGSTEQPSYDLLAGPVKSQADAKKLCKALAAKGVPCKVETFGGDAL